MIAASHMKGKRVAVFGLGRSGLAACLSCLEGGAGVVAWDDNETSRKLASQEDIPLQNLTEIDFTSLDSLVLAPGVPLTHPVPHWTVDKATQAGIPIIGDTELFVREIGGSTAKLIAITGTNGKSTTTALIDHICAQSLPTQMGGNIGVPVLELAPFEGEGVYVIEFSSYQIDLTPSLKPDIAICLNLSPDHLDRHGDMQNYALVKEKIFAHQTVEDTAIIGDDDDYCRDMIARVRKAKCVSISGYHLTDDVSVLNGSVYQGDTPLADLGVLKPLIGNHNGQNIAASYAAARALNLSHEEIISAIQTFPGLAHRMEYLGGIGHTDIINDSKATNVEAASMALSSLSNIHWIVGGLAKEGGIDALLEFAPAISHAYLIGDSAQAFSKLLDGHMNISHCGTMEKAVSMAARNAKAEDKHNVILLSPACASFDQYPNFEIRGEDFKKHVSALEGFVPAREIT